MTPLNRAELGDAPDHPILQEPWSYTVTGVSVVYPGEPREDSLSLSLSRDGVKVELHFTGITGLEIDDGFPYSCMGLEILDISHLHWDGIRVRVEGYEPAPGIRFWARSVSHAPDPGREAGG
jgi:hypothetical protein